MDNRWSPFAPAALALLFGGCAGTSTLTPVPVAAPGAGAAAVRRDSLPAHKNVRKSWMLSSAISHQLLYVSDLAAQDVRVYVYPGLTLAGVLAGFQEPTGECADRAGNVWIADGGANAVYEFSHGGTSPVNALTSNLSFPIACTINKKNGDLAVVTGNGVAVFHNADGPSTVYGDSNFASAQYAGYDNTGNLFMDGYGFGSTAPFEFAELPAGSSSFTDITLSVTPNAPGNVQWDGKYVAVGDLGPNIYQTQGSTVVNTVALSGAGCVRGFFIVSRRTRVIAPDVCNPSANIFHYPGGGSAIRTLTGDLQGPYGAVISK